MSFLVFSFQNFSLKNSNKSKNFQMRARQCARVSYISYTRQFLNMDFVIYQNFLSRTKMNIHEDRLFCLTFIRILSNSFKTQIIYIFQVTNLICGFVVHKILPKYQYILSVSLRKYIYLPYMVFYIDICLK